MIRTKAIQLLRDNRVGLALIVIAWIIFFSPILSGKYVYFLDDLKIIYYPLEYEYAQAQENWQLPVWSNTFGFGQPLIAWGQLGFLTPIHLLLRLIGIAPLNLLQVSVVSYFLVGLLGMYTFFRQRLFDQLPSAVAAVIFAFSGFAIGHLNHVNFYTSTMLLPWLLVSAYALLQKPTLGRSLVLALVAAATTVSGQPQIVLFVFIAAAGVSLGLLIEKYALQIKKQRKRIAKLVSLTILAGGLGLVLSAFAILPLYEFIPLTERAEPLPPTERLEFSYPPLHAVTLVLPYFFGNHENYWGAKGFQELAAFTGLIPLFLSGAALVRWKTHKPERVVGILFIALAVIMALGRHSFLYAYLVDRHIITSLGVAGRFVFFFDLGIMLLAASALQDLQTSKKKYALLACITGLLFTAGILTPFFIYMQGTPDVYTRFISIASSADATWIAALLGLLIIPAYVLVAYRQRLVKPVSVMISIIATATLLTYSWNYNPLTYRSAANASVIFADNLKQYTTDSVTPARLYSRPDLIQNSSITKHTDPISPVFAVYQPFDIELDNLSCFRLPMQSGPEAVGEIHLGLHEDPLAQPIRTLTLDSAEVDAIFEEKVCFNPVSDSAGKQYWLSITSDSVSGVTLFYQDTEQSQPQVYFVRKADPTVEQWRQSQKNAVVIAEPIFPKQIDEEAILLARHLNVPADSSSARWIGALSLRDYRAFIEFFFANDREPIDGDGLHVIQRYRNILNMVGVTHLAQILPLTNEDSMLSNNFELTDEVAVSNKRARLYTNPQAYPKAFMVKNAVWKSAADETRDRMRSSAFDPQKVVYISGPRPPTELVNQDWEAAEELALADTSSLTYTATVDQYTPTQVDLTVQTDEDAWLVMTDSTTPQWHTTINEEPAAQYVAYSVFKAAFIPAGTQKVSFTYSSPAIELSKNLTLTGLAAVVLLSGLTLYLSKRDSSSDTKTPPTA
ncbi:MAG: hypothetical protein WD200_03885 [Candidatus Andersenbacteria bacterium]